MNEPSETRIMLHILAQLGVRYPESLFRRQNVVAAQAGDRFIKAGTKGQADIIGCHKGRYIELEVKRPGEKQSKAQREYQLRVERAGGLYSVVESWAEAQTIIMSL